jgi:hypothetical protein
MLRLPPHGVIANIPLAPLLRAAMFAVKRWCSFLRVPDTKGRSHFVRHGQIPGGDRLRWMSLRVADADWFPPWRRDFGRTGRRLKNPAGSLKMMP